MAELPSYLSALIDLLLDQGVYSLLGHVAWLDARLPATKLGNTLAQTQAWALWTGCHSCTVRNFFDFG